VLKYIAVVGGVECDAAAVVDDDVADFVADCSIEKCNLLRNPCVVSISLVVIMFVVMYLNLSPFKKLLFRNFNEYYIHSYVLFMRINTS